MNRLGLLNLFNKTRFLSTNLKVVKILDSLKFLLLFCLKTGLTTIYFYILKVINIKILRTLK